VSKKTALLCALVALTAASSLCAKDPDYSNLKWKTGTLEDTALQREHMGTTSHGSFQAMAAGFGLTGFSSGVTLDIKRTWQGMVIRGDGYMFMVACSLPIVRHFLKQPREIRPNVTVHAPIKYAFQKEGTFYIIDENSQIFEMMILQKALLQAAP
jgi:hypothetical protein